LIKDTEASFKNIVNCKDRHLKIQRDRLVDEFTSALTAFQAVQKKCVEVEKNAVRQAKSNISIPKPPSKNSTHNNSYSENSFENNFVESNRSGPTQAQLQDEIDLQALEEQERTIRELEDNIVGVNEIYKKLGALVYEQGQTVDSIEASVENASVFVETGTEQLRRASHYSVSFINFKLLCQLLNYFLHRIKHGRKN
jgi:syntaxin 7